MRADGVFSGGGIKGLTFAGALQAASEAGYDDWHQLAGTSAGAITAMALAVGYDAKRLRRELDGFDFSKIADYGSLGAIDIPINLIRRDAVTRGEALHAWIRSLLANAPRKATVFGDLEAGKLQVVGVDLAHSRMVVFPQDVALYVDDRGRPLVPEEFAIADAVRISAGFPYFFPPLTLRDAHTHKPGVLVDGGVASAYPIFVFDDPAPQHPTWGFRLFAGESRQRPSYTDISGMLWPVEMLKAIVDTSTNALDTLELKEFGPRTISIPTGNIATLDFALTTAQKNELYNFGYEAAKAFFNRKPDGRNSFGSVPADISGAASPPASPQRAAPPPASSERSTPD